MNTSYSGGVFSVLVTVLLAAANPAAAGQSAQAAPPRDPAQAKAAAASQESPEVRAARTDLAQGRIPDALRKADAILKARPDDRAATEVKVSALLARKETSGALSTYAQFSAAAKREDLALLQPITKAMLQELAQHQIPEFAAEADAALAAAGDPAARTRLDAAAAAKQSSETTRQAERALAFPSPGARIYAIRTLQGSGGPEVSAAVLEALSSADDGLRLVAIEAAGNMKLQAALPALRAAVQGEDLRFRLAAAVALKRFGDATGDRELRNALAQDNPGVRLAAARAFDASGDKSWVSRVEPILDLSDPPLRVSAAVLLLGTPVREKATRVLTEAVLDPNPAVRDQAVSGLLSTANVELALVRSFLTDASPLVRLRAASSILNRKPDKGVSK